MRVRHCTAPAASAPLPDAPRRLGMSSLTHFSVCRSGRHVEIGFTDHTGDPVALQLPYECLGKLLMTLPTMIEAALRQRTGNPTLRQVYALGDWQLHLGSEPESLIISLATPDGFGVSFCASLDQAAVLGDALVRQEQTQDAEPPPVRH
jgi:hypothetical protein